jgi:ParB family chromosome partitioning protein
MTTVLENSTTAPDGYMQAAAAAFVQGSAQPQPQPQATPVQAEAPKPAAPAPAQRPVGGLGRGLSALIGETKSFASPAAGGAGGQIMMPIGKLVKSRYQPRIEFDETGLKELADSISKSGIVQPIVVRTKADGTYEIIAGERRYRAASMLGLPAVPVIIKELSDKEVMEVAIIENVQRRDLKALEEAQAYRRLLGEFGYTQEDLSRTIGKSRSHITNLLRLLSLPEEVKNLLNNSQISMGHARALLGCPEPALLAQKIVEMDLSVRQTEEMAKSSIFDAGQKLDITPERIKEELRANRYLKGDAPNEDITSPRKGAGAKSEFVVDDIKTIEQSLSQQLGAPVKITAKGRKGKIEIAYESLEQLDFLLGKLSS